MKTKILFPFVALFVASVSIFAQTPDGLSCETAIPVDADYSGTVPAAGTYYYSASTYDLPLTCYFYPETPVQQAPKVYVDFTCTPGYYEDLNLAEMIQSASGWGIATPIPFSFNYSPEDQAYILEINESYREMMTTFNITYNVDAIVQLTVPCAGEIRLSPDTEFRSCVENSEWLAMPDTIAVGLQQEQNASVLPLVDWRNDSIRFRWTGKQTPVTVWIGKECDFELNMSEDNEKRAIDMFVLYPDAGKEENIRNFTKQEILDYISKYAEGGLYYMRAVSTENAELIIEKKPMSEAMAKAKPLILNQATDVAAKNTDQLYYFPASWGKNYNMLWTSSSNYPVTAYFSNAMEFAADKNDEKVIDYYTFLPAVNGCELTLNKKQMNALCDGVTEDHVFVKFVATQNTNITPSLWSVGPCAENADELFVNDSVHLQRNATSTAWRVNINQWAKQDVKMYWKGTSAIKVFLCDTCKGFGLTKNNPHVKLYKEIRINTDATRDTLLITKDELAALVDFADSDGYMYFRFNNSAVGSMIITSTPDPTIPPEEPVLPPSPCVEASLLINSGDQLTLNLDSAFTIYRIEYAAWKDQGLSLSWTGTTDLHTFVAETCDFAVAPYNKYVHVYVPVQGEHTLDAAAMADLAEYVDEDGYLYIRFLTEKEGVLEVK